MDEYSEEELAVVKLQAFYRGERGREKADRIRRNSLVEADILEELTEYVIEHRMNRLAPVKLMDTFSEEELRAAAIMLEKKLYKAYEPIITQGEEGTDLFILESGSAMVQVKVNNIDSHTSKGEKTSESKDNSEALEGSDGEG